MRRIASTAKPVTSRTPIRTLPGFRRRVAGARITPICDPLARPSHDAALIEALKVCGHVRSGRLLRADPIDRAQSAFPSAHAGAPKAFVRQMESTSRDPFDTLEACGHGRTGCIRDD